MRFDDSIMDNREKRIFALRELYLRRGCTRYRMGKFEEYDLYARNKEFLLSEHIITFTDTNGRLMALKPDVTLSIVKSCKDAPEKLAKLCYNESVYRVSKGAGGFRELMQSGVECLGAVDERCVGETLLLAAESLALCADSYVLEVTHLDILRRFVYNVSEDAAVRQDILKCVWEKSLHGISDVCRAAGITGDAPEALCALLELHGTPAEALPKLEALCAPYGLDAELNWLRAVLSVLDGSGMEDKVRLDFSPVSNLSYYNGILFMGYVEGVPGSVLSGGQYDKLMRRMGRRSKAVGFAVYLDMLERLGETSAERTLE